MWVRAWEALRADVGRTRALEKVELDRYGEQVGGLDAQKMEVVNTCPLFPEMWAARHLREFEEVTQTREHEH